MKAQKVILWVALIVVLSLLLLTNLGFKITRNNNGSGSNSNGYSGNIPEKCRVPAGQDLESWKEHLGHHADTQECLKYFK